MHLISNYWFDALIAVLVVAGLLNGRKQGLSVELFPTLQWVIIVVVCGSLYSQIGSQLAASAQLQPNLAFVAVYLVLAAVIFGIFSALKGALGEKLVGAHVFGKAEFPLGAVAGVIRFTCVLFAGLALLSSTYVPDEEWENGLAQRNDSSSPSPFLTPAGIKRSVFLESRSGRVLKTHFGQWLIAAQPPVKYETKKIEGLGKKMERAMEEDLGEADKK